MLEERIDEWRSFLLQRRAADTQHVDELEDHLRSQVSQLSAVGLDEEEAFLIAIKRLGSRDAGSRDYVREYSERLWKRMLVAPGDTGSRAVWKEAVVALTLATAAGVAVKVPELFGKTLAEPEPDVSFYARNLSLFVLPWLACFFFWKRGLTSVERVWLAVPFVLSAAVVNLLPFESLGHTEMLAALHLPIALWLTVGIAYAGGQWLEHQQRMNYVRFSGEWFIYYALVAFGGGVLMGITVFVFEAIGLNVEWLIGQWVLPCGALGAVIVCAWLVETKQGVIENMAPVLTMIFTPLFTLLLLVLLGTMLWTRSGISIEREVLIGFDLLLVVVVGLVLYALTARDPRQQPGFFDAMQLLLVVCALLVDAMALWAIVARLSEFGSSPNRVAALGENLILIVNLGWSAVLYAGILLRKVSIKALERWQTAYLPVYAFWAWFVVAIFPLAFGFR